MTGLRSAQATLLLGTLTLLVVVAGGWLVLVGPATSALGSTRAELVDTTDANLLLRTRLTRLEGQRDDLASIASVAGDLSRVAPPTADQPGFFALIDGAARRAGVPPDRVTTLSPTVPVALAPATPATPATATPPTAPATPTPAPAPTPTPVTPPVPAALAVQSVTVAVEATYEQARDLLGELESMERGFLVRSVTLGRSEGGRTLTVTITGSTFVAPPVPLPDVAGLGAVGTGPPEAPAEASAGAGLGG